MRFRQSASNDGPVLETVSFFVQLSPRGFQVFITADRKLQYQQNIPAIGIAVVVLSGVHNKIENLRPLLPKVLDALSSIQRGTVIEIAG